MIKIAITGPESTGKSTLAKKLAAHFNTAWVPEFARSYLADLNRPYTLTDLEEIAEGQRRIQKAAEAKNPAIIFSDTDFLVLKIWSENAFKQCPEIIAEGLKTQNFDLHLLMDIDLPWQPDPQREHPHLRQYFFDLYKAELQRLNFPFAVISSAENQRLEKALVAIKPLLSQS